LVDVYACARPALIAKLQKRSLLLFCSQMWQLVHTGRFSVRAGSARAGQAERAA
jgi:hypothetical protein